MFSKIKPYLIVLILILLFGTIDRLFYNFLAHTVNQQFIFGSVAMAHWINYVITLLLFVLFVAVRRYRFGIGLMLAGSISILIDRILYKGAIDYIKIPFFPPAFNIADISIVFGAALIVLAVLFGDKVTKQTKI